MKIYRPIVTRVMSWLLVALASALAWGMAAPAGAASTDSSVQTAVSGEVGDRSGELRLQSSGSDTLTGASIESVKFSGKAAIKAKVVDDPDFRTTPIVVLSIDLSNVTGKGQTSGTNYVTNSKTVVQRRLRSTDAVQLTFPFWPSGAVANAEGPVAALSISLSFDVNTRKLTAAAGSITSP